MNPLIKILLLGLTVCLVQCSSPAVTERPKTAEELKQELKQQELVAPLSYISDKNVTLNAQQKKIRDGGLFRSAEYAPDGAIISGDFVSTATLAKFKDLVVSVKLYSHTETLIEEKSYVVYEYLNPNSIKHFSFKVDMLPEAYEKFAFEVTGATPVSD